MTSVTVLDLKSDAAYARSADKLAELQARAADLERRRSLVVEGNSRSQTALTARAESLLLDDVIPVSNDADEAGQRGVDAITDELAVVRRAVDLQKNIIERGGCVFRVRCANGCARGIERSSARLPPRSASCRLRWRMSGNFARP